MRVRIRMRCSLLPVSFSKRADLLPKDLIYNDVKYWAVHEQFWWCPEKGKSHTLVAQQCFGVAVWIDGGSMYHRRKISRMIEQGDGRYVLCWVEYTESSPWNYELLWDKNVHALTIGWWYPLKLGFWSVLIWLQFHWTMLYFFITNSFEHAFMHKIEFLSATKIVESVVSLRWSQQLTIPQKSGLRWGKEP